MGWRIAKKLGGQLESYHKASSLTFCIQLCEPLDGPQAGQTVPHVHIHILLRKSGDYENNHDIYDEINEKEKELNQVLKVDKERKDRSTEEMALEADEYKKFVF
ncbi:Nitrilase and fragile histidine triad fusion protein NitFhit [Spatholobus suberectus]|nr:Nitrilase and fragile histidine triad fusion protein NitFhit [Spatholobus suberectus]